MQIARFYGEMRGRERAIFGVGRGITKVLYLSGRGHSFVMRRERIAGKKGLKARVGED